MSPIVIALVVSVVSPMVLMLLQGRQHRKDKELDWAREDKVAARAEEAAQRVLEVAQQAQVTADLLAARQDAAAAAAEKAASDLIEANRRLAEETVKAAALVNGKLDQIHTLVNSNLTEAKEGKLDATEALIVALRLASDQSPEAVQRIAALEATAIELRVQIDDRRKQTRVAEALVEQGKAGSIKAEWESEEK